MSVPAKIDLNLLVVFEAVYAEGSVTRASERLHLTQPAISHALGRLRGLFNDPLFTRQGHTMVPTSMARGIIDPVRAALRALESTLEQATTFDPGKARRTLVMGFGGVEEACFLPALMARIMDAPCVDLVSQPYERAQMESRLAGGKLDVVVDGLRPHSTSVLQQRLCEERLVVVARPGHPALEQGLDLETYLAQHHVVVGSHRPGPAAVDAELSRMGRQRRVRLRCQDVLSAAQVVAQSDLLLTLPAPVAARALHKGFGHQVLPLPQQLRIGSRDLYLYWHESADKDAANRWLRDYLLDIFAAPDSMTTAKPVRTRRKAV
ncbi:MAG: LysR family transcriptional regulator [Proteobacteria bacterium]|nr:LysR family transcriptional regulator [Pseudomonadota bacterium]HQR03559.1 LysR family transcriptional regulator [Rhodocyclaceae bacterium]